MPNNQTNYFLGLCSFEILAMFRRGLFYAYLTIYLRHFLGMSVTGTTLFATLPMVVNILSQTLIWGRISDRFQLRRTLIIGGEIIAALGTVVVWYLHKSYGVDRVAGYIIIMGLTCVEFFWAMSNISWTALISDLYPAEDRGGVQGRLASLGGIGRIAGILIGGMLYDGLGRQFAGWGFYHGTLFFVAAGLMLASTLPLFLLPEGGWRSPRVGGTVDHAAASRSTESRRRQHAFWLFLAAILLINFGRNSIAIVFPQYLSAPSGPAMGSLEMSFVLNTQSIAVIIFGWTVGWLCRRFGAETTLVAASISAILAMIVLSSGDSLPFIYVGSFLRGIADATVMASAYEIVSTMIHPARRARSFAWFNATFFLSFGLPGTLIAGPLADLLIASGSNEAVAYRAAFVVAGLITASGLVMLGLLLYQRMERRQS